MPPDTLRDRIAQTLADMDGPVDADRLAGAILAIVRAHMAEPAVVERTRDVFWERGDVSIETTKAALAAALGSGK